MGPKSQSHPTSHSLFSFFLFFPPFLLYFSFFLSSSLSILLFVLQSKKLILTDHSHAQRSFCFLPIQCSFCSFFFVLLPPVTHTLTHAHPSREIISVNLRSHIEKLTTHSFSSLLLSHSLFDLAGATKWASTAMIWLKCQNQHPQQ